MPQAPTRCHFARREPRYPCPMVWSPPCAPRIAVFSDVAGEEEKEPEPSAAATTRDAVTGLEDAAITPPAPPHS